ncbi:MULTISPECIES: TolC family outer membrane protein [Thioclava]|uniref:Transporter n=1 Tax=Thioclava nitratireducens TaxID=1915078 RepID=A0ABN4XDR8_9RHOB|nr:MULTISPECIES: TolC family outer membrane protein [Thioclava]AQS49427.1 transporter [Thioclava nitratireducens]OWY03354.1 transporter [Thioclava sp. IC9]OWY03559.1 transporter [Thioclava sp. F1Mire-8]OWY14366.1 transporter [Thioclava sp. F34-6]OWY16010.1 transporter [Thioclava sp. JM3]
MLRKTLTWTALVAATAMAPITAGAETLADALVSAYRHSNLLEQNRAALRAADEDVAQAVANLRPVLQWTASYDYLNADATRTISQKASTTLGASMTLFDFGRNKLNVSMKKETVLATREGLRSVEQNVLLAAIQAYSDVKSASEQVAINQNSARVLNEELKASNDRFEVGEVTKTDVSLAQAQLASARASLAAAQGKLRSAREAYKAATGHYPSNLAAFPKRPSLPGSLDAARDIALRSHPSIKQLQHTVAVYDLGVDYARANRLPKITGSLGLKQEEQGIQTQSAGIEMSQTLYSGGALLSAQRQAVANDQSARAQLSQAGVTVAQNVANAWSAIDIAKAQISAYDQQITAARTAYQGVKEEALLGARTTLDVLSAEQDLLDAQAGRIDAAATLQVAYYQLLSAMGLLTVENLKLGIPTYDPAAYYNAVRTAPLTLSPQGKRLDRVLKAIGQ